MNYLWHQSRNFSEKNFIYIYIYIYIYISACVCVPVYAHVYLSLNIYMCACVWEYVYTYMYYFSNKYGSSTNTITAWKNLPFYFLRNISIFSITYQ